MQLTPAQAIEIEESSFIDFFDPKKHHIQDYKSIIIIGSGTQGEGLVNGEYREGQCIFIPYLKEEKSDYSLREIDHLTYFIYGLRKFTFGADKKSIKDILNVSPEYTPTPYEASISLLLIGHAVLNNVTYDEIGRYMFFRPESLSDLETDAINDICDSVKDSDFLFALNYLIGNNAMLYHTLYDTHEFSALQLKFVLKQAFSDNYNQAITIIDKF